MYKKIKKLILNYIPTILKTGLLYKMPFLYSLLEIKPSSSTIIITNRCNLRCIMCKQWREPVRDELRTEEWKEIIKDLKKNGIRNIHFTGGEPLLRHDLEELISFSCENRFVTGLTTNGILLKKEILESLIKAGLRSVALSIDALGTAYDDIRGLPDSFEKVKNAVSLISGIKRRNGIDAYINFTLMKNNLREVKKVKGFADNFNLPLAICLLDSNSSVFNLEENKRKFWIREESDFKDLEDILYFLKEEKARRYQSLIINFPAINFIKDYFREPRQKQIPCVSSQDRVIIDPYGDVLGGCMSMQSFGNIKNKSFSKLQKEEKYKKAKRDMFYKKCDGCSCGYLFNIRCFPRLIIRDQLEKAKYLVSRR